MTASRTHSFRPERGFIFFYMLAVLSVAVALTGVIGYTLVSGTRFAMISQQASDTRDLLRQAAYILTAEATNADADDAREPVAGTDFTPAASGAETASNTATFPSPVTADGWYIPKASTAPKLDAWKAYFKFCAWDNGSVGASTGRLAGDTTSTYPSAVAFAVISAGPDKIMQTSCAQAKANTPQGDDIMRSMINSQMVQGVGGTAYFGDPVANTTALEALPASAVKKGQIRVVNNTAYINLSGTGGTIALGNWASLAGTVAPFATAVNVHFTFPISLPKNVPISLTNPVADDNSVFKPVVAGGGAPGYTFSVSPALPAGLVMNSGTGVVSGAPTVSSGATTYTVTVTDTNLTSSSKTFSLAIAQGVTATTNGLGSPASLGLAPLNQPITPVTPVTASGGLPPYTYSISPALPTGLIIGGGTSTSGTVGSGGAISGTPTTVTGPTAVTITVTDSGNFTATATFDLSTSNLPAGYVINNGLIWSTPRSALQVNRATAANQCTALTITGYTSGWRLPTWNEANVFMTSGGAGQVPGYAYAWTNTIQIWVPTAVQTWVGRRTDFLKGRSRPTHRSPFIVMSMMGL